MPWIKEPAAPPTVSVRERGRQTVKALGETSRQLFPLREKGASGQKLTRQEQRRLRQLEAAYAELEQQIRVLLRPRDPHPELRGLDHTHGPESLEAEDH